MEKEVAAMRAEKERNLRAWRLASSKGLANRSQLLPGSANLLVTKALHIASSSHHKVASIPQKLHDHVMLLIFSVQREH
ncbi:hypothetical protein EJ110_NYTH08325 [Nymphaea thermarum]|nr:hypothetical protein EJ110_NYTH08325 [Nymphaea thermarum]